MKIAKDSQAAIAIRSLVRQSLDARLSALRLTAKGKEFSWSCGFDEGLALAYLHGAKRIALLANKEGKC